MNQDLLDQFTVLANLPGNQSYLLSHKQTNEIFVYKTVNSKLNYEDQLRAIQKRYSDLQNCKNLSSICYFTMQQLSSISILYSEPKVNFRKEIAARMPRKQYWKYEELLNTFWHTLVALNNFHYVGLFHGDIRVNSIACKQDGSILLLDQFCTGNTYYKTVEEIIAEQDGFLSPEFLDPNQDLIFTTVENDIFSLGIVFIEACTLKKSRDLYEWNERSFNYQIYQERLIEIEQIYGKNLATFIAQMTDFCVQSRITTEEALAEIAILKNGLNTQNNQQQQIQQQQQQPLLSQSLVSQKQSPHYLDQSLSQKSSQMIGTVPSTREHNSQVNGNSFDEAFNQQQKQHPNQQNDDLGYNVAINKQQQRPNTMKSQAKLNLNYNMDNKDQNQNIEQKGKLSYLLTNETIKDSRNQEITQFENYSISDNSVSVLSFENTMCSHNEDINDKRKYIPTYKKSVFKVKNQLAVPQQQQQQEKESSVFYMVEEEEGIDKQFIQKTMVNRIEKEKRELEQIQQQQHQHQHHQIQQQQQYQQQPIYQQSHNQLQQQPAQMNQIQQIHQHQQYLLSQQQNYQQQQINQQHRPIFSQQNQIVNKVPANPRSQQISLQIRRNSAFIDSQQILNQKENINLNTCQQIYDEPVSNSNQLGSQQAPMMVPDQFNNSNKLNQTRKIRGLNKSVDMSKTQLVPINAQVQQSNGNQIQLTDNIPSCKYSNKQEFLFPVSNQNNIINSNNNNNNNLYEVECNGINIISYERKNGQSPQNHERQGIHTLFNQQQNQNNCPPTYNYNKTQKSSQIIHSNKALINNKNNVNANMNSNEEWNYPSNSQRYAYVQIKK